MQQTSRHAMSFKQLDINLFGIIFSYNGLGQWVILKYNKLQSPTLRHFASKDGHFKKVYSAERISARIFQLSSTVMDSWNH
jgi:hypothetical protein